MLVEQSHTTDFSVVDRMFGAIERGDIETVRSCFAAGALIWHNYDELEQDVDGVVALLGQLCAISTSRVYLDRRVTTVGSQAFLQHTLNAALRAGPQLRVPAMMRVHVNADGLVERIEEYVDSRVFSLRVFDLFVEEIPS